MLYSIFFNDNYKEDRVVALGERTVLASVNDTTIYVMFIRQKFTSCLPFV